MSNVKTLPDWLLPSVESLTEFPVIQIGQQLSRICRYAGATPHFYSVARHSLLVAELVPNEPALKLLALVHDAHECWTGDVLRPAKLRVGFALDDLTRTYDEKLWALLGLDPNLPEKYIVQMADDAACDIELAWLGKSFVEIATERPDRVLQNQHLEDVYGWDVDAQEWMEAVCECREKLL